MKTHTTTAVDQKIVRIAGSGIHRGLALDLLRLGTTASVAGFKLDISVVEERSQRSNVMAPATALRRRTGVQIRGGTLT
jgi:hypothetical protein